MDRSRPGPGPWKVKGKEVGGEQDVESGLYSIDEDRKSLFASLSDGVDRGYPNSIAMSRIS